MYTPAQVGEMLGIPASTLRHYAKVFEAHLSSQTGRRHRIYSERDIVVIMKVIELSKLGKPLELIGPLLDVVEAPDPEGTESPLSLIPGIAREIENAQNTARSALSHLASLEKAMNDRNAQLDQLAADLAYTRNLLNDLYKYSSKPWWRKLFSKPPANRPAS